MFDVAGFGGVVLAWLLEAEPSDGDVVGAGVAQADGRGGVARCWQLDGAGCLEGWGEAGDGGGDAGVEDEACDEGRGERRDFGSGDGGLGAGGLGDGAVGPGHTPEFTGRVRGAVRCAAWRWAWACRRR